MVDREMISAISELMDEKLEGLKTDVAELRTDVAELRTDVAELRTDVAELRTDVEELKADVEGLKTRVDSMETVVGDLEKQVQYISVVQLENNVIKRLSTIESCYLDTFQRYKERTEQFDKMAEDIVVLKSVVSVHSENWKKYRDRRVK